MWGSHCFFNSYRKKRKISLTQACGSGLQFLFLLWLYVVDMLSCGCGINSSARQLWTAWSLISLVSLSQPVTSMDTHSHSDSYLSFSCFPSWELQLTPSCSCAACTVGSPKTTGSCWTDIAFFSSLGSRWSLCLAQLLILPQSVGNLLPWDKHTPSSTLSRLVRNWQRRIGSTITWSFIMSILNWL